MQVDPNKLQWFCKFKVFRRCQINVNTMDSMKGGSNYNAVYLLFRRTAEF